MQRPWLRMAALLLAASIAAIVFGPVAALAGNPPKGVFIYTISRNGDPVGQQRLEFVGDGERLRVLSHTTLDVSFLGMNLYGFEQQVEEVHQGDHIVAISSDADDDGTSKKVELKLAGDRLKGNYNGSNARDVDPKMKTSLFWDEPALGVGRILDLLRAKVRDVTVTDLGPETLRLPAGKIEAHHLRVSGELKRELWYDADGILVAGELKASDGSTLRQELLQRP
ncbi:MAG TPA: DUF6134 family protein [Dongiaceae bacterium]|nr:DUF6134 family protein [Dongiaceae bacterium]